MKYCYKCGNPMEDDMKFCQKCGTKSISGTDDVSRASPQDMYGNHTTAAATTLNNPPKKKKKKRIGCLIPFAIGLIIAIIVAIGGTNSDNDSNDSSKSSTASTTTSDVSVEIDVTQYANITSAELIKLLGEPNDISNTTPATGFVEIPCTYYDYNDTEELGEVSFLLINDRVAKFTAYKEFPFYKKDKLLSSLNVKKSDGCVMAVDTDTAKRFRCVTDEIDDLWITNIKDDSYGFLAVTYDMMYFEEWYLPMSISEQTQYQCLTQDYVKSVLKAPKSADFPNISDWAIVKNDFYIAAQSYVDAVNSFGAELRSKFTFIYPVGADTPIYAVFDGEVIANNGYVSTADLVKELVDSISKTVPAYSETSASVTTQIKPDDTIASTTAAKKK